MEDDSDEETISDRHSDRGSPKTPPFGKMLS
jgi:hypothetical protein